MRPHGPGIAPHDRPGERVRGASHLEVAPRPFQQRQVDPAGGVRGDPRLAREPLRHRRQRHRVVADDHRGRVVRAACPRRRISSALMPSCVASCRPAATARASPSSTAIRRPQPLRRLANRRQGLQRVERSEACRTALERRERGAIPQAGAVQHRLCAASDASRSRRRDILDRVVGHGDEDDARRSRGASVHGSREQLMARWEIGLAAGAHEHRNRCACQGQREGPSRPAGADDGDGRARPLWGCHRVQRAAAPGAGAALASVRSCFGDWALRSRASAVCTCGSSCARRRNSAGRPKT